MRCCGAPGQVLEKGKEIYSYLNVSFDCWHAAAMRRFTGAAEPNSAEIDPPVLIEYLPIGISYRHVGEARQRTANCDSARQNQDHNRRQTHPEFQTRCNRRESAEFDVMV